MIHSFKNDGTADLYSGRNTQNARRTCPKELWRVAARKLDMLDAVTSLEDLRFPPGNRLEHLKSDRENQYSLRINQRWRICFIWSEYGPAEVEVVDYH